MSERSAALPLAGISVLVTRALEQSADLVEELGSRGANVTVIPAVSISPLPEPEGLPEDWGRAIVRGGSYDNLVFTSVNGVAFTLELLASKGLGPGDLPPALCVGEKTAGAWEQAGGEVASVPEHYTANALLDILGNDLGGRSFLIMRPEVVRTDLAGEMGRRGADVDEVILYRTEPAEGGREPLRELMAGGGPDVVFFASPSAVEGLLKISGLRTQHSGRSILEIPAICIGPTTARAAEEAGFKEVYFPDEHTADGMVYELMVIAGGIRKSRV